MEGLPPTSGGDHCRVSSEGGRIRSVCGAAPAALGRESALHEGPAGRQETDHEAVGGSRRETAACPRVLGAAVRRCGSKEVFGRQTPARPGLAGMRT